MRSVLGVVGGHDDITIFGRMWWNRFRMSESGLFVVEYSSAMVGCRWTLFKCLLRWIPLVACHVEVVNVSTRLIRPCVRPYMPAG